jgi:hypothetical protein
LRKYGEVEIHASFVFHHTDRSDRHPFKIYEKDYQHESRGNEIFNKLQCSGPPEGIKTGGSLPDDGSQNADGDQDAESVRDPPPGNEQGYAEDQNGACGQSCTGQETEGPAGIRNQPGAVRHSDPLQGKGDPERLGEAEQNTQNRCAAVDFRPAAEAANGAIPSMKTLVLVPPSSNSPAARKKELLTKGRLMYVPSQKMPARSSVIKRDA